MKKFVFCFLLIAFALLMNGSAQSKTKIVKGNYCGVSAGSRGGDFAFRVGSKVRIFYMNFGQDKNNAKMVRFNPGKVKVGDEFVIKFDNYDGVDFIIEIRGTGKKKKIEPCTI